MKRIALLPRHLVDRPGKSAVGDRNRNSVRIGSKRTRDTQQCYFRLTSFSPKDDRLFKFPLDDRGGVPSWALTSPVITRAFRAAITVTEADARGAEDGQLLSDVMIDFFMRYAPPLSELSDLQAMQVPVPQQTEPRSTRKNPHLQRVLLSDAD